ncbi:WD40 repeat domain-containing protein [Sansalvadorimonas sp. 2012CJ34-2]|uniref:WD40 repeat domain-containing protein n=1 Tax=Parendozoicomonas callyspongiae TaxID=2942213 RepID=A0ABT0PIM7_9GAMM|nr:WD40 repeat domain-containing protein [Sansalvadorimonas sp. 2012CJ34-2]MCL6271247.1 WD40 repeat domain-containing protein [Sansalvadorimonas sp. 2012CJ34-2]
MGALHQPEYLSVVVDGEHIEFSDCSLFPKYLTLASESLTLNGRPKAVCNHLSPPLKLIKNIQIVNKREQHAPSLFRKIFEKKPTREQKVLKALEGKRRLQKVRTRESEQKLLPTTTSSPALVTISNDGQWMMVPWRGDKYEIVVIHNLAHPAESYGIDFSFAFGRLIKEISKVEMAPDNKAMMMIVEVHDQNTYLLGIVDFENATFQLPQSLKKGVVNYANAAGGFSPNGKLIFAYMDDKKALQVIDWRNDTVVYETCLDVCATIRFAVFEDNETILVASECKIHKVDIKGSQSKIYDFSTPRSADGDDDFLRRAEVSSGGRWVIASKNHSIRVYSRKADARQIEFKGSMPIPAVTSKDDKVLYVAKGGVYGYSLNTGELVSEYCCGDHVTALITSTDGQTLIVGYRKGLIRIWDINTGLVSLTLKRQDRKSIAYLWLTPDHKYLASLAHSGEAIEVWRLHINESKVFGMARNFKSIATSWVLSQIGMTQ